MGSAPYNRGGKISKGLYGSLLITLLAGLVGRHLGPGYRLQEKAMSRHRVNNTGSSRLINMHVVSANVVNTAHCQDCYLLLCLFLAHENLCIVEVATYLCLVLSSCSTYYKPLHLFRTREEMEKSNAKS